MKDPQSFVGGWPLINPMTHKTVKLTRFSTRFRNLDVFRFPRSQSEERAGLHVSIYKELIYSLSLVILDKKRCLSQNIAKFNGDVWHFGYLIFWIMCTDRDQSLKYRQTRWLWLWLWLWNGYGYHVLQAALNRGTP